MNHIAALCDSGLVKKVTRKGEKGNSSNIYLLHLDGAGDSLGGSANNSLSGAANSPGSAGVAPGGGAGDSPRTSHSFEPVKEPVNEPIAVGASADESVRVRSNRPEYSPEFEQAWLAYPKRAGGNSKSAAFKAWKARLNEGVKPETMLEGVKRYAGWVSAMGNSGTQFVKQARSLARIVISKSPGKFLRYLQPDARTRTSKPVTTTWTTARSRQDSGGDHESVK